MVEDSFTGAGKRPLRDHAHKVLLPNGRNGNSWLARLMPCGGKCVGGVFGYALLEVLSMKGITGLSVVCCCVICIAP